MFTKCVNMFFGLYAAFTIMLSLVIIHMNTTTPGMTCSEIIILICLFWFWYLYKWNKRLDDQIRNL